jgi:hypothetical protein
MATFCIPTLQACARAMESRSARFPRTVLLRSGFTSRVKRPTWSEECCEGLDQAQECSPVVGLVGDRLQLSTKRLFAPAQPRHALPQLFDRQESFLVGGEQSFDAFANMYQFPLQTLLMFFGGIRGARCCQPSIKFLLY